MMEMNIIKIDSMRKMKNFNAMTQLKEKAENWINSITNSVRTGIPFTETDNRVAFEGLKAVYNKAENELFNECVEDIYEYFNTDIQEFDSSMDYVLIRSMISLYSQKREAQAQVMIYDQRERLYA